MLATFSTATEPILEDPFGTGLAGQPVVEREFRPFLALVVDVR